MEMWLSADTALWSLDRLSIGCSAEWSMVLGFEDSVLKTLSWIQLYFLLFLSPLAG